MRIALLGHAPIRGGSTDLLFQVRDYFQRAHEVTVIFGEGTQNGDPRAKDATILPTRGGNWRDTMRDYVKVVESFQPDIAYGISGAREIDLFRFLRCARVRHVSSLEQHGFADIPHWLTQGRDYIEACSANTPDALEEVQRLTGRPTYLLPYRLPEFETGHAITVPESADPAKPVEVAFVGRLERFQKRAHWLPEIVRRCAEAGALLHWHIYGDGPDAPFLHKKFAAAPNVTLHGWTSHDQIYRQLPTHDLMFFCSRWEGLPIAMVEGMRCGLACVTPDIPAGIHWTLSQGGGWLYHGNSASAAAHALTDAARDRNLILEKRHEALRLSSKLFSPSLADEYYPKLEAALKTLKFNGRVLNPTTAPKFHAVPLTGYARRLRYAAESAAHSPGQFLLRVLQRDRETR